MGISSEPTGAGVENGLLSSGDPSENWNRGPAVGGGASVPAKTNELEFPPDDNGAGPVPNTGIVGAGDGNGKPPEGTAGDDACVVPNAGPKLNSDVVLDPPNGKAELAALSTGVGFIPNGALVPNGVIVPNVGAVAVVTLGKGPVPKENGALLVVEPKATLPNGLDVVVSVEALELVKVLAVAEGVENDSTEVLTAGAGTTDGEPNKAKLAGVVVGKDGVDVNTGT